MTLIQRQIEKSTELTSIPNINQQKVQQLFKVHQMEDLVELKYNFD